MKVKTIYKCSNCAYQSGKWQGKCPTCEQWNTIEEDTEVTSFKDRQQGKIVKTQNLHLYETDSQNTKVSTGITELDLVIDGGFQPGSLVLMGGEPGIGKSTLTLQISSAFIQNQLTVLYISAEESINQVANRGKRINADIAKIQFAQEYSVENIVQTMQSLKPDLVVVDSIQLINSDNIAGMPGSISQVRMCTEILMEATKKMNTTTILVGHVTKDGNLAGPRVLEHLVDTVLQIEGDRNHEIRMLRSQKNRFGPTNEVGIFEMTSTGLKSLSNPSEKFLKDRPQNAIGSCLTCVLEGKRPLILEVQALTTKTSFGYPKRLATGFDLNRLNMLIAVLQKHARINLFTQDVFINVVGGFKINDPAADLAVCSAICSSVKQIPMANNLVLLGEIGLTGEIRKSNQQDRRIKEVEKLNLRSGDERSFNSKKIEAVLSNLFS
ncbi:DNA repair protein RadA [Patescibacteria group bacterium]|nr:DNA repair protein RadA [Patescibacteria group bacterium]